MLFLSELREFLQFRNNLKRIFKHFKKILTTKQSYFYKNCLSITTIMRQNCIFTIAKK